MGSTPEETRKIKEQLQKAMEPEGFSKIADALDELAEVDPMDRLENAMEEIARLKEDNAALCVCLAKCAVPLETLAGQIRIEEYRELSPKLQGAILDAVTALRKAVIEDHPGNVLREEKERAERIKAKYTVSISREKALRVHVGILRNVLEETATALGQAAEEDSVWPIMRVWRRQANYALRLAKEALIILEE